MTVAPSIQGDSALLNVPFFDPGPGSFQLGNTPKPTSLSGEVVFNSNQSLRSAGLFALSDRISDLIVSLDHRCSRCRRRIVFGKKALISKSRGKPGAFFGNLEICSNLWLCPICEAIEMRTVRFRLQDVLAVHHQYGRSALLVTFTAPHGAGTDLASFWPAHNAAVEAFFRRREVIGTLKDLGFIGRVSAVENTWSDKNGWHNHRHELLLISKEADPAELKLAWAKLWKVAAYGRGLKSPTFARGLTVQIDNTSGKYLTKIASGLACEMTMGSRKVAKEGGLTPWEIVARASESPASFKKFQRLFLEYARASKGKRRIWGIPKVERFYAVELARRREAGDALVPEKEDAIVIASVGRDIWVRICALGLRFEVLDLAERVWDATGSQWRTTEAIIDFVLSLGA